jgi:hypothetical protein
MLQNKEKRAKNAQFKKDQNNINTMARDSKNICTSRSAPANTAARKSQF